MKNRKIKFRVWLKTLERFVTKDEWLLDLNGDLFFKDLVEGEDEWATETLELVQEKNYIVQQFTGLFDKNGKEVFEGDIIINHMSYDESFGGQRENSIGVVEWISMEDGRDYSGWMAYPADLPWGNDSNYTEIIGNIMENLELIQ